MKDCLSFIVNNLLGHNKTEIIQESNNSTILLTITPLKEDIGKLIGKNGKIIKSIRKLLKIRASKEGKRVFIKI